MPDTDANQGSDRWRRPQRQYRRRREADALGYWLGQPYWSREYGREAVAAIVDYGYRTRGRKTIRAHTDPPNVASQRLLRACGLQEAGEVALLEPHA